MNPNQTLPGNPIAATSIDSWIFGDECGHIGPDDHLLVGLLRLSGDWRIYERQLESICADHGVHREIKFAKTDRITLPVRLAFIDWFAESDGYFKCIVKAKSLVDFKHYQPRSEQNGVKKEDLFFNHTYKQVLEHTIKRPSTTAVLLDQKTRNFKDNFLTYLNQNLSSCYTVREGDSKDYRLLQLADLLTGCVSGDIRNIEHPVKGQLVERFKASLKIANCKTNSRSTRHNVWHWRPN